MSKDYPKVVHVIAHNQKFAKNDKMRFRTLNGTLREKGYVLSARPDSYEYFPNVHEAMAAAYPKKEKNNVESNAQ